MRSKLKENRAAITVFRNMGEKEKVAQAEARVVYYLTQLKRQGFKQYTHE
jgi:hypothetical protein